MADDSKKDARVKAPVLRAKYKSKTLEEFIEKYSRDISRSGMWIKSGKPPALNTLLKVEILLEDGTPVIAAVGRVVKRREEAEASAENPAGMGIRFLKVEEASQPVIERIVALKGEDAGPHFEAPKAGGESNSAFFGKTDPSKDMPPESERTMMRQMNALLGEALRQVGEAAPRKPGDAATLPTQKATIMGVAAPQAMLEQAIAAAREENKKADDVPTKVATRSEIDTAIKKSETTDDGVKKPEALKKLEVKKPEASKAEVKKPEAPKVEEKQPGAPKAEAPRVEAPKVEAKKPEAPKAEEPKADAPRSFPPRALTTKAGSIPPPPSTRPIAEDAAVKGEGSSTPPPEPKADAKPAAEPKVEEKPAEPKAEAAKVEEKPAEPKAEAAKVEEKPAEPKAEEKPAEPKAEEKPAEPKAEEKPAVVAAVVTEKAEEKKPEPKVEAKKPEEKKAEEKKPEPKVEAKKPAEEPEEGGAVQMFVTLAVIALLAFLFWYILLRGPEAGQHPGLEPASDVSAAPSVRAPRA